MMGLNLTPSETALPDGVHAPEAVRTLARMIGWDAPIRNMIVFDPAAGFREPTAFIKTGDGNGYYMTTLSSCTCPAHHKGGQCKHQRRLAEAIRRREEAANLPRGVESMTSDELATRKARIQERNRERCEAPTVAPSEHQPKGFNQPEEEAEV